MTFEEAIIKSVRAYFKGKDPKNLIGAVSEKAQAEKDSEGVDVDEEVASGQVQKYTRSYLDELEASLLEDEDEDAKTTSKKRRKKDKEKEESEDTSGMGGMGDMDEEDVDSLMGGLLSKPVRKKKR